MIERYMGMEVDLGLQSPALSPLPHCKRRRLSIDGVDAYGSCSNARELRNPLPALCRSDYYTEPCLSELAIQEFMNPGYCSSVRDFVIGRIGYGSVKFVGETDVRSLDLDCIVNFERHEVIVYEDESSKPSVGSGLNKPAEVTLLLYVKPSTESRLREIVGRLKRRIESQGGHFLSFDPLRGEWKFLVQHFSRFGLVEDDEDDIVMGDASPSQMARNAPNMNGSESSEIDADSVSGNGTPLLHSLPAHLGLDPSKMKDLKMLMFPSEEDEFEGLSGGLSHDSPEEFSRSPLRHSSFKTDHKKNGVVIRKTPLALLEYNPNIISSTSPGAIVLAQGNKGSSLKAVKQQGFVLELENKTPVTASHSNNIVDAALFMGRSFRVGWGPNGVLVHSGMSIGTSDSPAILSSVINVEKVVMDKVARDESNNVNEEVSNFCFVPPLEFHRELDHETRKVGIGNFELKLQKLVFYRFTLPDICRRYIDIIEKQLEASSVPSVSRVLLMHEVLIWELIKVLFSSRKTSGQLNSMEDDENDEMGSYPDVDEEALPLMRRAELSYWLQESVYHRVQEEVSSLDDSCDLMHIFLLLTGRQLDTAVELAASRGDVRLACLLSQSGGSPANRDDIANQLDTWRKNGFDFNFIEMDRLRLLELLSGNIHGALDGVKIDWKRFLGMLMWYHLPPHISLPVVFNTYQKLLNEGNAPYPVPVYVDEGPTEVANNWDGRFDLAYYLMLLHARQENDFGALKTMFSAFASTDDPLDYHMIWHHRAVLEAIGTFSSNDLHVLDMAYVSQLLCVGQCHWAIYVVLHMPHREDYPYLQATVVREILFQYCEVWSSQDEQWKFIEDLGIPSTWLHEALAIYFNYMGDLSKALHHFMECENWQKAHSIFVTSVAHSLYLSAKHTEIWQLSTSMEDHKSEIEDWNLGAGLYISFYLLRNSLQDESHSMTESNIIEEKNAACSDFIGRLNKSLVVWGSKLSLETRVVYSKMSEEISTLLLYGSDQKDYDAEVQLSSFDAVFKGPKPEDLRSYHFQDSVSLFVSFLSQ